MLDRGMDPQQAADARESCLRGKLRVEQFVPDSIVADLARRGTKSTWRKCRSAAVRRSGSTIRAAC